MWVAVSDRTAVDRPLSPEGLTKAFSFATDWLGVFIDEVNSLNVYPVPDGDTGTNMHLTMQSVRRQLQEEKPASMPVFSHALSYGSLLGARGNSGVILSQILKGFADEAKNHEFLGGPEVASALTSATASAYDAVLKPAEGTILTVVREAAEAAAAVVTTETSAVTVLMTALEAGRGALERTPEMLPILKQAGVVDAGGLGLLYVLEGVIAFFEERNLPPPPEITDRAQQQFEEEAFGFCTEFLLADVHVPTVEIQKLVQPFGDSLLVVGAEGFVKGHIHTEEPEQLLAQVSRYGRMVRSKVEDMSEQHSEILAAVDVRDAETRAAGVVAVGQGYGVTKVFRSLGVRVVGGGQTNNPSVQDIADAVRSVGASEVIVMPNNKNIVLAAQRVAELVEGKSVYVLPTRTLGQGLAATVHFREALPAQEQLAGLQAAADASRTVEVTVASRAVEIDGVSVAEGAFIGLLDGALKVSSKTAEACLLALVGAVADDVEVGTLFYSAEVGIERAEALVGDVEEAFEDLEIELQAGAPDLYPFVMALE